MTPEEARNELIALSLSGDTESAHGKADDVLCELLNSLGYSEVVKAYLAVDKWYA
jgi:hypothetical protein